MQIVLAEYNSLRSEMVARTTIQATLLGSGLSGLAVIIGFAIGNDDNRDLLVLVPFVSAFVLFLYANESYRVVTLGDHIRSQFDFLRELVGLEGLPSWEHKIAGDALRSAKWVQGTLDGTVDAILIVASVVSLLNTNNVSMWELLLAFALLLASSSIRIWVGFRTPSLPQVREWAIQVRMQARRRLERD